MNRLLSANMFRMFKSKVFYVCVLFMFGLSIYITLMYYFNVKAEGYDSSVDDFVFINTALIGIVSSLFCSIYIGTDYSDGTIRNKMIIGHSRVSIYLSNLISCISAGVLICLAYFIPALILGVLIVGGFVEAGSVVALRMLCVLILTIAFSAIFTLISMLVRTKALGAVVCILSMFFLLFTGVFISSKLKEPEVYEGYTYIEDGEVITEEDAPNPNYLSGTKRKVYEFLDDFLPGGQSVKIMSERDMNKMGMYDLYSGIIAIVTTAGGLVFFHRKDLK